MKPAGSRTVCNPSTRNNSRWRCSKNEAKVRLDIVWRKPDKSFRMKVKVLFRCLVLVAVLTALAFPSLSRGGTITNNLYLATPGSSWSLEIGAPGFEIKQRIISTNGTAAQLLAQNREQGVTLSAFLEKVPAAGDAKQCREYFWNKAQESAFKPEDVKMSETGSVAVVEYTVKVPSDNQGSQRNIDAFLSRNGCWIGVLISKVGVKPGDEDVFQSIVSAIRFNDNFAPNAGDLTAWGGFFMSKQKYAEAVRWYEKAMELEKAGSTLDHRQQVFLLDDLIICHGNLGHIQKAKELSELGLEQEPDYPSFYYNLACSYAELGKPESGLGKSEKSISKQVQIISGGQAWKIQRPTPRFPNTSSDPGFAEFFSGLKN